METNKLTTIIIPCYNAVEYTKICIESIFKYTTSSFELILIDNGSDDGTGMYLRKKRFLSDIDRISLKKCHVIINKKNIGVSAAINQGIRLSKGHYICYLNNDMIVTPLWLEKLIKCIESSKKIGIVGNEDVEFTPDIKNKGAIFKNAERVAFILSVTKKNSYIKQNFINGRCMFFRKSLISKIGLFDESFFPCWGEDLDFSLRAIKKNFKLVNAEDVHLIHFHSRSTNTIEFNRKYNGICSVIEKNIERFVGKWGKEGERYLFKINDIKRRWSCEK